MSFESSFRLFLGYIEESEYDLPEELKDLLKEWLKRAGFCVSGVVSGKRLSSYNLFMREKMFELKSSGTDSRMLMSEASKIWKTLGEDAKSEWKLKASAENDANGALSVCKTKRKKKPGPKKLSVYQMFVKGMMPELKSDLSLLARDRMGKIGELWKCLSAEEKSVWRLKAEEFNAKSRAEYQASHPEWSG
jgi:hypothetical protein